MATQALTIQDTSGWVSTEAAQEPLARQRIQLADLLIDQLDLPVVADRIGAFLRSGNTNQIVTVNLDFLNIARRNAKFRSVVNSAELVVADGMPLIWASRVKGQPLPARITGHELIHECARLGAETGESFFLLGAAPGVAEIAGMRLQERYPGLKIARAYSPTFEQQDENDRIIDMVQRTRPGFLLVALGAPLQDLWIHTHRHQLSVPVCIGVGCVLDVLAGCVRRAPSWIQRSGLEWSFRLAQEPQRLWRRYVVDDLPMFGRLMLDTVRFHDESGHLNGIAKSGRAERAA
jgi:N-acetylglucosaminyldiphosphoundecaprenol N-acetyl-beta-D-mannosaminyltransferase